MHHKEAHFWQLYVEIGTPQARIHRISGERFVNKEMKRGKTQRFNQYLKSHIEGAIIEEANQADKDRLITLKLTNHDLTYLLIIRLYSASKANVIICDSDYIIQDLMYRRPNQHEISKEKLILTSPPQINKEFIPRENLEKESYNEFIESIYITERFDERDLLVRQILAKEEKKLSQLLSEKEKLEKEIKGCSDGVEYKRVADLLSSNVHLLKRGEDHISLTSFENDTVEISLDSKLSPGENIQLYYQKFHKEKAKKEYLLTSISEIQTKLHTLAEEQKDSLYYQNIEITKLREIAHGSADAPATRKEKYSNAPGLHFFNGKFDILVGRNVNENDELLRRFTKGNDYWMHTRDYPGGYVIIKSVRNKTVDLETILDAGNLALLFSKAKNLPKADTYYTQVKFLKRVKGGKKGLVLPSNEKNYTIELDENRIAHLFEQQENEGKI
jgi:predicted ribosome quality control (RQC) complex YloA/Tae2 family protein